MRTEVLKNGYFYPRPPRGGRPDAFFHGAGVQQFLSTPSARRATFPLWVVHSKFFEFLSTPSARRATGVHFYKDDYQFISIHALREEGDRRCSGKSVLSRDFYPRPPRGGRPVNPCHQITPCEHFYPRPPRGGRRKSLTLLFIMHYFYPRPPRGGRLPQLCLFVNSFLFLSTPSARRATSNGLKIWASTKFLSTPSARRATLPQFRLLLLFCDFYPRPPRGGRPCAVA